MTPDEGPMTMTDPTPADPTPTDPTAAPGSVAPDSVAPPDAGPKPSGLRNPAAAVRGVGAGALAVEALVLLLAIAPIHVLDVRRPGLATGVVVGLAVVCVLLAGMLRRSWVWPAGLVVQVALIACGWFHLSLAVLGGLFLLVWLYVLNVRRTVLGKGANPPVPSA
jgi:hypothetical protein